LCEQNLLSSAAIEARTMSRSIRLIGIQSRVAPRPAKTSPSMVKVIGGFTKRYASTHRIETRRKATISFTIQPMIRPMRERVRRRLYRGIVDLGRRAMLVRL